MLAIKILTTIFVLSASTCFFMKMVADPNPFRDHTVRDYVFAVLVIVAQLSLTIDLVVAAWVLL